MITAVDTNILLDVLVPHAPHGDESQRLLDQAVAAGTLVICEPVYAELAVWFLYQPGLDGFLVSTRLQLDAASRQTLFRAGKAWQAYLRRRPVGLECPRCGAQLSTTCQQCGASTQPRQHLIADFIIGAHAELQADRLLTRDRRYYRTYFPNLALD